jgi:hypothetical protein
MSTEPTASPIDDAPIQHLFRHALSVGVTPAEIAALICRKRVAHDPGRCPRCKAELALHATGTQRCPSCNVSVHDVPEAAR